MAEDRELLDLFGTAAARGHRCRIVYKDALGEHHTVVAVPRDCRVVDGMEWCFFVSTAGEELEVRLEDMVIIEPQA